jgi:S-methylmethionine-dependent homocysteine/selenocysteine methylase
LTRALPLARLLATAETVLLDGAVGTELDRRGVRTTLPLWSALGLLQAPAVVREIHRDYVRAGADVVIANTFRTTRRTLARAGEPVEQVAALNDLAVALAREATASSDQPVLVAGSLAPLEDCYSPWLSPPFDVALSEHREQARLLAAAGADFVMVETMPCATEAEAAVVAARETGLEVTAGFVLGADGRLLSGESLAAAVPRVARHGISAVFVNCSPAAVIASALPELRNLTDLPLGGYANLGVAESTVGWAADESVDGDAYAETVAAWVALGARLVGGCCGTRPEHIAAVRRLLDRDVAGRNP